MDTKYELKESIVAFIDILGSSEEMKSNGARIFNLVHSAYDAAIDMFNNVFKSHKEEIKIKIYSDNIVISGQNANIEALFFSVVILSALIQEKLLQYELLSRGGIAKGDFFIDDIVIWGTALVDAYNLENSVSIYPRIVIHPKLLEEIKKVTDKNASNHLFEELWITQDQDGLFYVDYFNDFKSMKNPKFLLDTYLDDNAKRKEKYKDNIKISQKIVWHDNYLKRKLFELTEVNGML